MFRRLVDRLRGYITRFLDNNPRNQYENIVFNMIRTGARQYGMERIVT